jgi:hypothetical protein
MTRASLLAVVAVATWMLAFADPAQARVFDPGTGRFIERDPIGQELVPNPVRGSTPSAGLYT